jgi:hypothetical protein
MAGLDPAIHAFVAARLFKTRMPRTSPGMTSISCGCAVDERDVALTQAALNLRVNPQKRRAEACGA